MYLQLLAWVLLPVPAQVKAVQDQIPQGGERNDAFTKSHIQNQTAIWMPQHKVLRIRLIVMRSVLHLIRLQSAGCHLRSTPRSRVFPTDFFVLPAEDAVFLPGL